jgi:hypothetical protein
MLSRHIQLLRNVVFFTSNSRKTTTPKLIRNPALTKRGTLEIKPKSYNYDLSAAHVTNKHLYWNRTEQNRLLRNQHRLRRFKKLGIRSLVRNGAIVEERQLPELLRELRDRKLIQKSPGRTLGNILELLKRFGAEAQQHKDLLDYVLNQMHKQVALMSFREFSMYILLIEKAGREPTLQLFSHFYHHLISAESVKKPLKIDLHARLCRFFFNGKVQYPERLLHKDKTEFKLFEDNDPRIKSF